MKQNMGFIDRSLRLVLAAVFIWLYSGNVVTGTAGIVLLVLGGVFILTGIAGVCPLYSLFGLRTRKTGLK